MTPTLHLPISGRFGLADIEPLLEILAPVATLETAAHLTIDLRKLEHISPAPLTALVTLLADALVRDVVAEGSRIVPPQDLSARRHLEKMQVPQLLGDAEIQAPPAGDAPSFVPCNRFVDHAGVAHVSQQLTDVAADTFVGDPGARVRVMLAIEELAMNVLEHAASTAGGFAAAELDEGTLDFEVAFADCGVGVRASLARNPDLKRLRSDAKALVTALEPGVSGRADGAGMYLSMLEQAVCANGGILLLRSGAAQLQARAGSQDVIARPTFRGTLVAFRVNAERPFAPFETACAAA